MSIEKFFSKLQRKSSSKAGNSAAKVGLSGKSGEKVKKKTNKAVSGNSKANLNKVNASKVNVGKANAGKVSAKKAGSAGSAPAASTKASVSAQGGQSAQSKGVAKRQSQRSSASLDSPGSTTASGSEKRSSMLTSIARSFKESATEAVCREVACEGLATSAGYCRLHYIKNWKKIKRKEGILREGKLNQYIEELVAKYPDKYIEAIRQDLANDKDFAKVIYDLDLDETVDDFDVEGGESVDSLIDTIKREFDDEGETF